MAGTRDHSVTSVADAGYTVLRRAIHGPSLRLGGALVVGWLVASLAGGCGASLTPSGTVTPPAPTPLPTTAAPGAMWGPLAVVPPQGGMDLARAEGTLRITDLCVFLETTSGEVLLLWPADRTAWNARDKTIGYRNPDGSHIDVADGTRIAVGGGGDSDEESGLTTEAWLAHTQWVARPAATCPLESRWTVGALMP